MVGRALWLASLVCTVATPAWAFDCAKAQAPVEKAICTNPAAKAADEAMEGAFGAVRDGLQGDERRAVLADQRAWLKKRNARCGEPQAGSARCLADADADRVRALTGEAAAGPGLPRRPVPVFVAQAGGVGRTEVAVRVYRFPNPASPGERAVNAQAETRLAAIPFKADDADDPGQRGVANWGHDEFWTISYASPRFVSIRRDTWDFTGGAHGSSGTGGVTVDWATGRVLTFRDLFDPPARVEFDRACLGQITAARKERGADAQPVAATLKAIAPVVSDLTNWVFTGAGATVFFDPYVLGSYAEGTYTCELPAARIERLAKLPVR